MYIYILTANTYTEITIKIFDFLGLSIVITSIMQNLKEVENFSNQD